MAINTKLKDLRPARERYQRTIKLLSNGLVNGDYFPDGQLVVYPWDNGVDEWLAQRVRKGAIKGRNVLFSVLPRVCNLNGCPPDKFLSSEVLLVLMVSRAILRNNQVTYDFECPHCSASGEAKLSIPDNLTKIGEKFAGWPGYDDITLAECQDVARVRPITVGEELAVIDRPEAVRLKTCGDAAARVISGLISVNGGAPTNPQEAITWFNAISPADQKQLIDDFDKTQPQLDTEIKHECDECGKLFSYNLRLDEDFFRRERQASDGGTVAPALQTGVQK